MGFARKKAVKAAMASLAAGAMLLTAMPAYAGIGSGGGGVHGGGNVGPSGDILYLQDDSNYTDSPAQGWGQASIDYALQAMRNSGYKIPTEDSYAIVSRIKSSCTEAINQAVADKSDGDATQARVIGVAATIADGSDGLVPWGTNPTDFRNRFDANWNALGDKSDDLKGYDSTWVQKVHDKFTDQITTTGNQYPTGVQVVCVAVNNQQPPRDYDLTVTTNQQSAAMRVGSTDPVHDTVHANRNGSGLDESLNATAILHYDGHPNGYVAAKSAAKTFTMKNAGDTRTPDFTPADLGMKHWQHGNYWFDIQVSKQGHMQAAVDTTDREAAETYTVPDVPPETPVKKIEKGTSASRMVNRTTITSGTGRGGYEMTFKDTITLNGVNYEISDYRLVDLTDNGRDVSGEFAINWDKAANTVTAVRTADKGEMPLDHQYEFSFDVTVSKPDFSKVQDTATVMWNRIEKSTDGKEFKTWRPNSDKSWIKKANGKWAAVVDPTRSNATGADTETFLDHSEVASVVNGTIASDLIQEPTKVQLKDDWANSDYIFDAAGKDKIRVFQKDIATETQTSANDIANTGKDVTDRFDIVLKGTVATATAKASYLKTLKGLKSARQITMLVPGKTNFADGKGAGQVRRDFGKDAGDELTFCANPGRDQQLTNAGSETVNDHEIATNEPYICGYIPPAGKDVVGEASQGGDQESVQGKVVQPGQRVEYQLDTQPQLPSDLAYTVRSVSFTDSYDPYLKPDRQTLEMMDLNTGKPVSRKKYTTTWDDSKHMFTLTVTDQTLLGQWRAGASPRLQVRFEGTVAGNAPTTHRVGNKWVLTLNDSLTPSNEVFNIPPKLDPVKRDTRKDPTVSIDGRTALLGDEIYYHVDIDARQTDQAYKVWRLGMTDDYDDEYLKLDAANVEITDETGKDVTGKFNLQDRDGVLYAYARLVDTEIPATGETVKGDPQPEDLKAYGESDGHDPLSQPAIDQTLLGHTYTVSMPMTVIKVTDGHVVRNRATQVLDRIRKDTNEVTNPLKPINPAKDVTVKVGGASANGRSVYKDSTFLYQLDSSILPSDRAYPQVDRWDITDALDPAFDEYTGQWAVYASRDLYRDGQVIASKGERIAGSDFDSSKLGGDLFTLSTAVVDGRNVVTIEATGRYRALVSDDSHEAGWRAYIQCRRLAVTDQHENRSTEHCNDKESRSNIVWTRTPDMTPSISVEKWDRKSGWPNGDRDNSKDALTVSGDTEIVFTITNTSKTDPDTQQGAVYRAKDLKLEDSTIVGDGEVVDIKYPSDWDAKVLKPGESVEVTGTLKGVTKTHTDRAKVTGTPLTECPVDTSAPFGGKNDGTRPSNAVDVKDGDKTVTLCSDTKVESNTDDWNGYRPSLARTGAAIGGAVLAVLALASTGVAIITARRRKDDAPAHAA